ncbi:MAG TPA: thiamine phosphate synthase [bacterium]|nr:thiamine phosphate synthase [bacterium]
MTRDWRVCVITDTQTSRGRSHREIAEAAIRGGATIVQLRMKDEPARRIVDAAREILPLCRAAGVTFVINDRADVAMIAGADGVHIGQDDLPAREVRAMMGPGAVIGISAATAEEAVAAERAGADYLGVGAIYATATKADAGAPVGLDRLRELRRVVRLPLIGTGGITADTAAAVIRAGAQGVAVITAATTAEDIAAAVRRIRREVDAAHTG